MTGNCREQSEKAQLFEFREGQLRKFDKISVAGDLHGDFSALRSMLDVVDPENEGVVFLGDYADRGDCGVEVIDEVSSLIDRNPVNVVGIKGNHEEYTEEGRPTFYPCDLIDEAVRKRGGWQSYFHSEFKPFVSRLHLAAIIPGEILFVHGGVSSKITSLSDLRHPTEEVERDILWSDPFPGLGEHPNRRGAGIEYGEDITKSVCRRIGVKRIVRSHEPRKALRGPHYEHGSRVLTVSSTSVYGGDAFILEINPKDFSSIKWRRL